MHPQLTQLFDEAENRYLKPDEIGSIHQYITSLPERLDAYRSLRDQELDLMQRVADQLQRDFPSTSIDTLARSLKHALLLLRASAMAMLLDDEIYLQRRLLHWLTPTMQVYQTQAIDTSLYRSLNQQLQQTLTPQQMQRLKPMLVLAQTTLLHTGTAATNGSR
ncbi:hypothetical protein H6F67_06775 [Microcoleus sp. FACHB-1515]|uniref:hypothetical protein n=1 Tax=Cyanophyceae TaxID=3028117 RepID=UPI00168577A2|nr:hypothetical protein [Microcoleus sp. FACHB-1515]MBD2089554.1 hypothetical protein [Microcoleus sp. FACHB-1515]